MFPLLLFEGKGGGRSQAEPSGVRLGVWKHCARNPPERSSCEIFILLRDRRKMRRNFGKMFRRFSSINFQAKWPLKNHKEASTFSTVHQIEFFHCCNSGVRLGVWKQLFKNGCDNDNCRAGFPSIWVFWDPIDTVKQGKPQNDKLALFYPHTRRVFCLLSTFQKLFLKNPFSQSLWEHS